MRGAAKMMMARRVTRDEGGQQNEARGATNMEAWNEYRMEQGGGSANGRYAMGGGTTMDYGGYSRMDGGSNAEARRYKNGRFAPKNEAQGESRPKQIGFRYEEEPGRYRADVPYPSMNESAHKKGKMEKGHAMSYGRPKLDKRTMEEWVQKLGQKWSAHQVEELMAQLGIECDPMECFVAMNMLYSDFRKVAQKHGCDNPDFWINMAKAFLEDEDAVEDKLAMYYDCIVEK